MNNSPGNQFYFVSAAILKELPESHEVVIRVSQNYYTFFREALKTKFVITIELRSNIHLQIYYFTYRIYGYIDMEIPY